MRPWREAATLILAARNSASKVPASATHFARDPIYLSTNAKNQANTIHKIEDFRVLFLKRSPSSIFMPSRLVFPGGVTQSIDWSPQWRQLFEKVHEQSYDAVVSPVESGEMNRKPPMIRTNNGRAEDCSGSNAGISADIAFRICAIRETFEECGLLLCVGKSDLQERQNVIGKKPWRWDDSRHGIKSGNHLSQESLQKWRHEVNSSPAKFLDLCNTLDIVPNVHALIQWRNWLTPVVEEKLRISPKPANTAIPKGSAEGSVKKILPRRFDTMFYLCCMDCDTMPETSADNAETTTAEWYHPTELLTIIQRGVDAHNGERKPPRPHHLAPPQVYELTMMQKFNDLETLCSHAREHQLSDVSAQCWMPDFRSLDKEIVTVLPGDYMYPDNIDYIGTDVAEITEKFQPPPMESLREDQMHSLKLNRIVYSDQTFQNGTVICNVL